MFSQSLDPRKQTAAPLAPARGRKCDPGGLALLSSGSGRGQRRVHSRPRNGPAEAVIARPRWNQGDGSGAVCCARERKTHRPSQDTVPHQILRAATHSATSPTPIPLTFFVPPQQRTTDREVRPARRLFRPAFRHALPRQLNRTGAGLAASGSCQERATDKRHLATARAGSSGSPSSPPTAHA